MSRPKSQRTLAKHKKIRERYAYLISNNDGQPMKQNHALQRLCKEYTISMNGLTTILFEERDNGR